MFAALKENDRGSASAKGQVRRICRQPDSLWNASKARQEKRNAPRMEEMKRFNVRVYGCLTHPDLGILTSVEKIQGNPTENSPADSSGEGIRDCLQREFWKNSICLFMPERISIRRLFQRSAFRPNEQVISIYMEAIPDDGTKKARGSAGR